MTNSDETGLAGLQSEKLKAIHGIWRELAAGRIGPKREEITPTRLRDLTAATFTIDVIDGGKDFRFRFAGDRIIQFIGHRLAGSLLSERRGTPFYDTMQQLYERCTLGKAPLARGPVQTTYPGKEFLEIETIILPLSDDGVRVTGLFGAMVTRQLRKAQSAG